MRLAAKIALWLLTLGLLPILWGVFLTPACTELAAPEEGAFDVAVVLGGGMAAGGRLYRSSAGRVEGGVALVQNGVARRLHMTGGTESASEITPGAQMERYAISLGVSPGRISQEDASLSTLQNALFSKPYLDTFTRVLLVSNGFHLARAWLGFRWAGIPVSGLCHSAPFGERDAEGVRGPIGMLAREVLAYWFNLPRAGLWSMARWLGFQGPKMDALLR